MFKRAKSIVDEELAVKKRQQEESAKSSNYIESVKTKAEKDLIDRLEKNLFAELRSHGAEISATQGSWTYMIPSEFGSDDIKYSRGVEIKFTYQGKSKSNKIYVVNDYRKGQPNRVGYQNLNVTHGLKNIKQAEKMVKDFILDFLVEIERSERIENK